MPPPPPLTAAPLADTSSPTEAPIGVLALPGDECLVLPRDTWHPDEKWAWNEICQGRRADFNRRNGLELDPKDPDFYAELGIGRTLGSTFLATVLAYEPFRSAVPHHGVRIEGAYFPDRVLLADATIKRHLALTGSRFDADVDLSRLTTTAAISLDSSKFTCDLEMTSAAIGGDLSMADAEFRELDMNGANIAGGLRMNAAAFDGPLHMDSVVVAGDLLMLDAPRFDDAILRGVPIGDQLGIAGAVFDGVVDLDSATIDGDFIIRGETVFLDNVQLNGLQVQDQLSMNGATFQGELSINAASVGGSLLMSGSILRQPADLRFLSVSRNIDLRGATVGCHVDLTGARIGGSLRLGDEDLPAIDWSGDDCRLMLRNTRVGAVQDADSSWPDQVEMDGFVYGQLDRAGGLGPEGGAAVYGSWLEGWLKRDRSYSPQPYRHLANVLRDAGHKDIANGILFAGRERERLEATPEWHHRARLLALKKVIGYGYGWGPLRAVLWLAGLVVLGAIVLRICGVENRGVLYSLDMALPIRLREEHYTEELKVQNGHSDCVKWYLCGHQLVGYLLICFVIAVLSGLVEQ